MQTKLFRRSREIGIEHHLPETRLPLKQLRKADVEPVRRLLEPTRDRAFMERYYFSLCMAGIRRRYAGGFRGSYQNPQKNLKAAEEMARG